MKSARALRLLSFVVIAFCLVLVTDAVPWLRGDAPWIPKAGRWVWPYGHPRWLWLIPSLAGVALYVAGALRLLRDAAAPALRLILWAWGGSVLLPLLLLTLEGRPLFLLATRSASPVTGGYQTAAALIPDLGEALRHWPQFLDDYRTETKLSPPSGVALSPPGLIALYDADKQLFAALSPAADRLGGLVRPLQCQNLDMMTWSDAALASAWMQLFMPFWAALAVAPLYALGRMLFDRERARWAVALWPLIPGLAIFQPRFNVFFPLITLVMLLGLWRGLLRNRVRWIAASGFVLSVGLLFNLALMPLGLLAGLILIGFRLGIERREWRRLGRDLIVFGLGVGSAWAIYGAASGLAPWTLVDYLLGLHYDLDRPYLPWLFMHPYDMFIFVGLPVAALAIARIIRLRRRLEAGDLLAGAAGVTLVLVVLSGTARGETGRVWLFLAPVWLLLAADLLVRVGPRQRTQFVILQAVCLLSMAAVLRANFTALTEPPRPAEATQGPTFPVEAHFVHGADRVTFVGLSVEAAADQVTLHLYWRADDWVKRPYVLSLVGVAPDGSSLDSLNWDPLEWDYPPSCWTPERTFVDTVRVPLGEHAQPGGWSFSLSIRDVFTQELMTVTLPDGSSTTQVGIGPVAVP